MTWARKPATAPSSVANSDVCVIRASAANRLAVASGTPAMSRPDAYVGCAGGVSSSKPPNKSAIGTFSISGTISPAQGGATLRLSGAATATATTDGSGNYSFTELVDGPYIISASKPGFNFSPARQNVTVQEGNVTGVNFTTSNGVTSPTLQVDGKDVDYSTIVKVSSTAIKAA